MTKEQKNKQVKLSRREFIAGTGAVILTGMLGGCTAETITSTVTDIKTAIQVNTTTINNISTVTETVTSNVTDTETVTSTVTETVGQSSMFTVTDMAGRVVEVPRTINKIATFGSIGVLNAFVEAMGCGSKIANQMSANFTKSDKWKYQYVFAPQIADGPVLEVAGEIDIEAVLQLNPDLCLCMTEATAALLEEKGLCVIYIEWQLLSDVEKCVTLLGEVLCKQDIAADYIEYFNQKVSDAEALTAGLVDEEKTKVLYGNITSYTQPHAIAEWWISEAGGISVTDNGRDLETVASYTYTLEDLLLWNPDVMITTSNTMGDELLAMDTLSGITAVQNNDIYYIPTVAHVWGNRTPEQPLTVMWLMNKLYPDIMPTDTLMEEIRYYYSHFFLTDLTDEQLIEIIG
jgi:iron complex transport system substrate-binding protein